jgi:hypothetical protein
VASSYGLATLCKEHVVDRYRAGVTIAGTLSRTGDEPGAEACAIHGAIEEAVLDLLEDVPEPALEAA